MNMTEAQLDRFALEHSQIELQITKLNIRRCNIFGVRTTISDWKPQKDFIQVYTSEMDTGKKGYYTIPRWVLNLTDEEAIQDHFVREKINGIR